VDPSDQGVQFSFGIVAGAAIFIITQESIRLDDRKKTIRRLSDS
jgi:hypothetical protein